VLLLGAHQPLDRLLDEHLAARVAERELTLPTLPERAEDLRALALQQLSRIGMRLRGQPMGLSMEAQELLNEHSWPANQIELEAVLWRAALSSSGEVVGREALAAALVDDPLARSGPHRSGGRYAGGMS
jgi:DNA-binding NtrC family response regulator